MSDDGSLREQFCEMHRRAQAQLALGLTKGLDGQQPIGDRSAIRSRDSPWDLGALRSRARIIALSGWSVTRASVDGLA